MRLFRLELAISPATSHSQLVASPIEMLLIKHGGQLLAKLPVVPGAEPTVKVPLPDDDARFAAEERLGAVRENLIDIVARRNILIARVRQKIEKKDFRAAEDLLRSLDELPNKSQFNLSLTTFRSIDSERRRRIQRRIDQMFDADANALHAVFRRQADQPAAR